MEANRESRRQGFYADKRVHTPNVPKRRGHNEWENKKRGTSWKEKIKIAIDGLLGSVKNLDDLTCELEEQGFAVKRGKYISVKAPEQKRFVRLKTLGDYYSEDILCERIQIALEEKATLPKAK